MREYKLSDRRLERANELIEVIKTCGRKFFSNTHGHDSKISRNHVRNLVFIDDYTGAEILLRGDRITSTKFSHGGGLNDFIMALARYIRTGQKINYGWLGRTWGYGDDIHIIKQKALELQISDSRIDDHIKDNKETTE